MTDRDKLLTAARLIREVDAGIDLKTETCSCCGAKSGDKHAWMLHSILKPLPEKLERIAGGDQFS